MPSLRTIETFLRAFNIKSIAYVMLSTPFFKLVILNGAKTF